MIMNDTMAPTIVGSSEQLTLGPELLAPSSWLPGQ